MSSAPQLTAGVHRPTALVGLSYGADALATSLPAFLKDPAFPSTGKLLLLTGASLSKTDLVGRVQVALGDRFGGVFSSIGQHSPVQGIQDALDEVRRLQAVGIVAFGGGSVVDAAKVISHLHNEQFGSFLPEIAIPTTLSVAECTSLAGYTNEKGDKVGVSSPKLAPMFIIYDPALSLKTPERLWLSTGMRAVDHAVEVLYRPDASHVSKELSLKAIQTLFKYLPITKAKPDDVNVRAILQIGAWESLGSAQLACGLGPSHALGHKLGAKYSIPHGMTSCLTLGPTVTLLTRASLFTASEKTYLLRAVESIPLPASSPAPSLENAGELLGAAITRLVADLGLKTNLTAWKVPEGDLEGIAQGAIGGLYGWGDEKKPQAADVAVMLKSLL